MKKKFLVIVAEEMQIKHYSPRTIQAYTSWIRRFIIFNKKRHLAEMGKTEVQNFLNYLTLQKNVSSAHSAFIKIIFE